MSAQQITYWNSRSKTGMKLFRDNSNVTVRTYKCGCQLIIEHSELAQKKEHVSCGKHEGRPSRRRIRMTERFV